MNKHSLIDYAGYILFKLFSPLIGILPPPVAFSIGKGIGMCLYVFDVKHRAVAYANVKQAFGAVKSPAALTQIVKASYRSFGQNIVEFFLIPFMDDAYLTHYVRIEGLAHVQEAFSRGKGVIFIGVHAGSWELSSIIAGHLGIPFNLFVQNQKYPRLNRLLNSYRLKRGCALIEKKNQTRRLIEIIHRNEGLGMTVDQGGKTGTPVQFFGKDASMSSGAVRLALKYGVALLPVFYRRIDGPYLSVTIAPAVALQKHPDPQEEVAGNLQKVISSFQAHIGRYPHEYLWTYKIWKYSRTREVLILDDGKTGHLRQSQAVSGILKRYYGSKGIAARVEEVPVGFKSGFLRKFFSFGSLFSGKYSCQGCGWCLARCLTQDAYARLCAAKFDVIVSCGSSTAALNFLLSREHKAKSIAILKPSVLSVRRFDLVVMPRHDNPPRAKNVVVTEGALTLIDKEYLGRQSEALMHSGALRGALKAESIGVLLGGDTKFFSLKKETVATVLAQIKTASEKLDRDILFTTSRRTSREIEDLAKRELSGFSRCKLQIIAHEKNFPFAVGGILAASSIVVVSPESISMVCEAIQSGRAVVVFSAEGLSQKHRSFLARCASARRIFLSTPQEIGSTLEMIVEKRPAAETFGDPALIAEALERIL